jgi:hypothetical protein
MLLLRMMDLGRCSSYFLLFLLWWWWWMVVVGFGFFSYMEVISTDCLRGFRLTYC